MVKSGSKANAKRKHVEELQESDDRFRILADDAPVLIWVRGPDGSEFVNHAYLEFVGVSREVDVLHFDWTQYVHPDDRERYLSTYLDCFRRQVPFNAVLRFRRHDGVYHWMKSIGKPRYTPSGEFYGYVGSTQDITDVKLLEDELLKARNNLEAEVEQRTTDLRESEEKYRRIVETANEGIWVLDREDVTSFVNPALARMLGCSQQEIIGRTPYDFIDATYQKKVLDALRRRRGGVEEQYICKFHRKDGGDLWAIITAHPLYEGNGEYAGAFAMLTDITERKRAEDEVKEAKSQAELYLDLMGHDINNMHQIALGYLEMARDMNHEAGESEFMDKSIEVLQRSARLISNVRKLQKVHDAVFQLEPVDVAKVLADVLKEFGSVPNKAVKLNLNGCEHCHVRGDELLHDVFANLVGNAIKHTVDHADINIDLNLVEENGHRYCRVMVEDNGPGIPDDFKGKIFNRLSKGTNKTKGMGLGLYLVKSLVESYGGRVCVEDRVQGDHTKGARFVVMLPALEKE